MSLAYNKKSVPRSVPPTVGLRCFTVGRPCSRVQRWVGSSSTGEIKVALLIYSSEAQGGTFYQRSDFHDFGYARMDGIRGSRTSRSKSMEIGMFTCASGIPRPRIPARQLGDIRVKA